MRAGSDGRNPSGDAVGTSGPPGSGPPAHGDRALTVALAVLAGEHARLLRERFLSAQQRQRAVSDRHDELAAAVATRTEARKHAGSTADVDRAVGVLVAAEHVEPATAHARLADAAARAGADVHGFAVALVDRVAQGEEALAALDALVAAGRGAGSVPRSTTGGGAEAVGRAVTFIEAHAESPIGLVEIVAAARVGPRRLQQAFRALRGTTPMAHLRRVRLDRAHQQLLTADPDRHTVAEIAAHWHFEHASRFAELYRRTYGRYPSDTLHA